MIAAISLALAVCLTLWHMVEAAPSIKEATIEILEKPAFIDNALPQRGSMQWFNYETNWDTPFHAFVSKESWMAYTQFKEDTCRDSDDEYIAERVVNNTANAYFKWEDMVFHHELRKKLLPQTSDGRFTSLIGTQLLNTLDPRLFSSSPASLCTMQSNSDFDSEAMAKEERDRLEDFLINKVMFSQLYSPPPPVNSTGSLHAAYQNRSMTASLPMGLSVRDKS